MKKALLVALLALGVSTASLAQGGPGGFGRTPAEQAEALKTSLSLTADQVTKVTAIFAAQAKTRDSLMAAGGGPGAGGDMAAMMASFTKMQNDQTAKIKAILTAQQLPIYQKQVDEMAERRKQMMQNMPQN
jgi:Spy/CpxP family protein refolding chaperone